MATYRAVVTGHSRGLGAAIAGHLLERGIPVLGISRHENADLARSERLREVQLDLSDLAGLTRWLETDVLSGFLDTNDEALLVNNAGMLQPIGPLETQEPRVAAAAVTVNVAAALALSAAFIAATPRATERRILHISSNAGRKAYAGWSVYCATKAALDHHARAVALDRTPKLRICSVAPGVVDTAMQAEIRASTEERFPERPRFMAMHREKSIPGARQTGGSVVDFLLSTGFGKEPVFDLRDFSR